jgi:hypothetical protein
MVLSQHIPGQNKENHENLSQNSRCSSQDSYWAPSDTKVWSIATSMLRKRVSKNGMTGNSDLGQTWHICQQALKKITVSKLEYKPRPLIYEAGILRTTLRCLVILASQYFKQVMLLGHDINSMMEGWFINRLRAVLFRLNTICWPRAIFPN